MVELTHEEYAQLNAQRDALASALEMADKVIGVMEAHLEYLSDRDKQRVTIDITNHGLGNHELLRRQALASIN